MGKKLWIWLLAGLAIPCILQAQAVEDKAAFLKRLEEKNSSLEEFSGRFEINIAMMGSNMKMPINFWKKGEKMRMDMEMSMPGMPAPMEQVMVMDSKRLIQYQKAINTVITADLTEMSDDMRKQIRRNQASFFGGAESISEMKKIEDEIEIEQRRRDGKNFYLITVKDLNKLGGMNSVGGVNAPQMFGRLLFWIDSNSLLPAKMEFYGEAEAPGMWIDFIEIKPGSVPDKTFDIAIPEDAKVLDMTDSIKNMFQGMK